MITYVRYIYTLLAIASEYEVTQYCTTQNKKLNYKHVNKQFKVMILADINF